MPPRPCTVCGEPHHGAGRCPDCARAADVKRHHPYESIGYNRAWRRLSRKARRLQPFCSACGSTKDLTCDHSEQAWERHARGLALRLCDVDVLCRSCNAKKGRARPSEPQGRHPSPMPAPGPPVRQENDHTPLTSGDARQSHYVGHLDREVRR